MPGDTVTVHTGVYREWVNPFFGGIDDSRRILYRAAEGEVAQIKGSEPVSNWKKGKDGVWTAVIPNARFGNFNPFLHTDEPFATAAYASENVCLIFLLYLWENSYK